MDFAFSPLVILQLFIRPYTALRESGSNISLCIAGFKVCRMCVFLLYIVIFFCFLYLSFQPKVCRMCGQFLKTLCDKYAVIMQSFYFFFVVLSAFEFCRYECLRFC